MADDDGNGAVRICDIYHRDPRAQPMDVNEELSAYLRKHGSARAIAAWAEFCMSYAPSAAVLVEELYTAYIQDFGQYEHETEPLLVPDLVRVILDSLPYVQLCEHETGDILSGIQWVERIPGQFGVNAETIVWMLQPEQVRDDSISRLVEAGAITWFARLFEGDGKVQDDAIYSPDNVDPDRVFRTWLSEVLVEDEKSSMGSGDVWLAFKRKFDRQRGGDFSHSARHRITPRQLIELVADCFPHSIEKQWNCVLNFSGVRWKLLPEDCEHSLSLYTEKAAISEWMREDAHYLLNIPRRKRVGIWLELLLEARPQSISLRSLWQTYNLAFSRSSDTHACVSQREFLEILFDEYDDHIKAIEVSDERMTVFHAKTLENPLIALHMPRPLTTRLELERKRAAKAARESIHSDAEMGLNDYPKESRPGSKGKQRQRDIVSEQDNTEKIKTYSKGGETAATNNNAAQAADDQADLETHHNGNNNNENASQPAGDQNDILPSRRERKPRPADGAAPPGPFIQRLRRRAQGLPLGDEEPGFPGISMKQEQRRLKRRVAAWYAMHKRLEDPDESKRPTAEEWQRKTDALEAVFPVPQFGEVIRRQAIEQTEAVARRVRLKGDLSQVEDMIKKLEGGAHGKITAQLQVEARGQPEEVARVKEMFERVTGAAGAVDADKEGVKQEGMDIASFAANLAVKSGAKLPGSKILEEIKRIEQLRKLDELGSGVGKLGLRQGPVTGRAVSAMASGTFCLP